MHLLQPVTYRSARGGFSLHGTGNASIASIASHRRRIRKARRIPYPLRRRLRPAIFPSAKPYHANPSCHPGRLRESLAYSVCFVRGMATGAQPHAICHRSTHSPSSCRPVRFGQPCRVHRPYFLSPSCVSRAARRFRQPYEGWRMYRPSFRPGGFMPSSLSTICHRKMENRKN